MTGVSRIPLLALLLLAPVMTSCNGKTAPPKTDSPAKVDLRPPGYRDRLGRPGEAAGALPAHRAGVAVNGCREPLANASATVLDRVPSARHRSA
jgi:hypothetical protein